MKLASSIAISHFLLLCCIMFFSPYFNNPFVTGARPPSTCSGPAQGYKGMLLAHRHGPCSPLGHEKSYAVSARILLRDERRVQSINTLAPSHQVPIPAKNPSLGGGNYVVELGFGTRRRDFNLIFDTGSSVTWIKCKPCHGVCGRLETIFDPKSSSTFSNTSNSSPPIDYFDGTKADGYWASDTLAVSPSYSIQNFSFVCVNNYHPKVNDDAGGLLAFGQGDNSFVSQTRTNVFCHCLPSEDAKGYLLFGPEARERCQVRNFTPLLSNPQDIGNYLVNFVGISIGNKTLKISYTASSSPVTMIDSGTVITRLPKPVYEQFSSIFRELMEEYRLVKRPDAEHTLKTCYELEMYSTVKIPAVVLHFENLDVNLDRSQVLWKEEEKSSVFCLAFAGNKNDNNKVIIGNHQLQKLNVLYDIQKSKLGIGAGNCG